MNIEECQVKRNKLEEFLVEAKERKLSDDTIRCILDDIAEIDAEIVLMNHDKKMEQTKKLKPKKNSSPFENIPEFKNIPDLKKLIDMMGIPPGVLESMMESHIKNPPDPKSLLEIYDNLPPISKKIVESCGITRDTILELIKNSGGL